MIPYTFAMFVCAYEYYGLLPEIRCFIAAGYNNNNCGHITPHVTVYSQLKRTVPATEMFALWNCHWTVLSVTVSSVELGSEECHLPDREVWV